jgi:hypothetical protein
MELLNQGETKLKLYNLITDLGRDVIFLES